MRGNPTRIDFLRILSVILFFVVPAIVWFFWPDCSVQLAFSFGLLPINILAGVETLRRFKKQNGGTYIYPNYARYISISIFVFSVIANFVNLGFVILSGLH